MKGLLLACLLLFASCALFETASNERVGRAPEPGNGVSADNGVENDLSNAETAGQNDGLGADTATDFPHRRILFMQFLNRTQFQEEVSNDAIFEIVQKSVTQIPGYELTRDPAIFESIKFDEDLQQYDLSQVIPLAKNRGFSGLVTGTIEDLAISESGDEQGFFRTRSYQVAANIQLRLIDVQSEQELFSRRETAQVSEENTQIFGTRSLDNADSLRVSGSIEKALGKMLPDLNQALRGLSWAGRIAKIDLPRYYVASNEKRPVRLGQLLKVYGRSQPVFDEHAKVMIGAAPGQFKGLLRVVDLFGNNGAIAIAYSGSGFQERDRVEAYTPPRQ